MILIVDDDCTVRESIELMLKVAGMECTAVSDMDAAVDTVRNDNSLQMAIIDMNLHIGTSGRDGIELLRKIKVLHPGLPVILISAWGTIPLVVEGMQYGAVDFISKPWSNSDFIAKIKRHIDSSEAEKNITLEQIEQDAIMKALRASGGNLSAAAESLGITRQSLYRRIQKYNI